VHQLHVAVGPVEPGQQQHVGAGTKVAHGVGDARVEVHFGLGRALVAL
jgi:hypothetical protein